jgi:hypothetical protein
MKLTLHVGLPKTATTFVQHTLSAEKAWLAERGVIYPGDSLEHHDLPKLVGLVAAGRLKYLRPLDLLLAGFASEVAGSGRDHVLISSEYLIETQPAELALLDEKLRQHFPALREVRVLCYVREPIAFSTSFCQQVVKSAHQRLSQFYETPWPLNLRDCLSHHVGQFGREAVDLRKFHPDSLKNGDILDDFLDALGVDGQGLNRQRGSLNTALTDQAVQIADALAAIRPLKDRRRRYRRDYRRMLEAIEGDRFVLPEAVQDRVIAMSGDDLAMLKQDFGIELQPARQTVLAAAPLPAATATSLAELIVDLVEGRKA